MGNDNRGHTTETPDTVEEVETDEAFDRVVGAEERVLVDFYADWCGPCQAMAPRVEEFAKETDAAVVKVNIEEAPLVGHRFDVRSIPTFLGFHEGEVVGRLVGVQDREALKELVN